MIMFKRTSIDLEEVQRQATKLTEKGESQLKRVGNWADSVSEFGKKKFSWTVSGILKNQDFKEVINENSVFV